MHQTLWIVGFIDEGVLQLVKAVEDSNGFGETVKAGTAMQEELKSAILLRCVGGQLKSYLSLTIGNNVQQSKTLRAQVLQWDRSQQKWATSIGATD